MPKNRYDPLLFLPYSLSVACQGKTTPEPSGTRLSFETHRTGEFRNVPGASKQDIQHMVKVQRILLKKAKKSAELLPSRIPAQRTEPQKTMTNNNHPHSEWFSPAL